MVDLEKEFARACGAQAEVGFDALPKRDRVLIAIWALEGDVNNGGFDQYYFNSSGDTAFFAATALELIGATRAATIVRRANAHFGSDGPPRDRDMRGHRLAELTADNDELFEECDGAFYEYPDDIATLLAGYLSTTDE